MNNSDFINGQLFSDNVINVTEWHANPAKPGGRGYVHHIITVVYHIAYTHYDLQYE